MRTIHSLVLLLAATSAFGHPWTAGMPSEEREALREHILSEWKRDNGQLASTASTLQLAAAAAANAAEAPATAKAFLPFTRLDLRADNEFLYVGSNGMPDHTMMVGITAWQQQVPLPQSYFGENAWRIPLNPKPAAQPAMIRGRFLRGAIALAVNGIPIFNPQNNRGEISYEIGELDQWGGHCGRADDYHYHITPLHLQAQAGKGVPVAYALDGYPIYGLTEPDGSPVGRLDECHGHETAGTGYHYHASMKYPYVIGGFHGEVVEAGEQVDPQPRANPVRPALQALRGAEITSFESTGKNGYKLGYTVNGDKRSITYTIGADGTYPFTFDNGREGVTEETYTARGGGGGGPPGGERQGQSQSRGPGRERDMRQAETARPSRPPAVQGIIDVNGDGKVSAQEFADHAKQQFSKRSKSGSLADAMAKARSDFQEMDRDGSGQLEAAEWQGGDAPPVPVAMSERKAGGAAPAAASSASDQPRTSNGTFLLSSPVMEDNTQMPAEHTGDGEGATLPLAWKGAPAGTQGYALIMDHADRDGNMKWYWTLYDIPASVTSLPKNARNIGKAGTGFKGQVGYEPPHSKGPGAKTYTLTLYALSGPLGLRQPPSEVNREVLLAAMKGKVLATSSLKVIHASQGGEASPSGEPPREKPMNPAPAPPSPGERPQGKGKGKGGPAGLVKPSLADTMKLNVYADNWFMLYVNGRLVAVDSIQFTPHNVVSVDFLPEYPMTIAVLAKDNADPRNGMEYGTSIGDGGFILKFADGTVTNARWKAKNFFHGPVNGDTANPQVKQEPLPVNWWAAEFDDRTWANAKEYTVEEVDPKQPYFDNDFEGAKFIWTDDIALDNTVIFRTKIEKPEWKQRWNTKPDLDVTGVPQR